MVMRVGPMRNNDERNPYQRILIYIVRVSILYDWFGLGSVVALKLSSHQIYLVESKPNKQSYTD